MTNQDGFSVNRTAQSDCKLMIFYNVLVIINIRHHTGTGSLLLWDTRVQHKVRWRSIKGQKRNAM